MSKEKLTNVLFYVMTALLGISSTTLIILSVMELKTGSSEIPEVPETEVVLATEAAEDEALCEVIYEEYCIEYGVPVKTADLDAAESFVDSLYFNVLGRAADTSGKEYLMSGLIRGDFDVSDVFRSFYFSDEFYSLTLKKTESEKVRIFAEFVGTDRTWDSLEDFLDSDELYNYKVSNPVLSGMYQERELVCRAFSVYQNRLPEDTVIDSWAYSLKEGIISEDEFLEECTFYSSTGDTEELREYVINGIRL